MGTHMWNSAPSRRGRRLSVDRSSMGFGTRPVKLPEPPQKQSALTSNTNVNHWNRSPELLSTSLQTNNTGGVQSGDSSCTLSPKGTKDTTPSESTALNLGKLCQRVTTINNIISRFTT
uniref:Uncharacterized protein n=1 Tax=Sphaeramia orbicularis TaxID=375764 RepID=A0A672ZSW5_9TELE